MFKNFLWRNKTALSVCVLTIAFGIGWWALSNPGTSSIGENITVGSNLYVTGKVGIGTTSPSQKLDVSGQIHATGDICTDAGGGKCLSTGGGVEIVTGTYTGNGGASKVITGIGFQPDIVLVLPHSDSYQAVMKTDTMSGSYAKYFGTSYYRTDHITFENDGFTVYDGTGLGGHININGIVYSYIAIEK